MVLFSLSSLILTSFSGAALHYCMPLEKKYQHILNTLMLFIIWCIFFKLFYDYKAHGVLIEYSAIEQRAFSVDWLSWSMISLSILLCTLNVIYARIEDFAAKNTYYGHTYLILGFLVSFFSTDNLFFFYIFFEAMLIPMFFLIIQWGAEDKLYAGKKFFLYTFLGSIPLLLSILFLIHAQILTPVEHPYALSSLKSLHLPRTQQIILAAATALAFFIKLPLWPVHSWLPLAHTQAPTGGSVYLAAIFLKVGAYGLLKITLPACPQGLWTLSPFLKILSIISICYFGLITIVQKDMKRLVASSSIVHMGIVSLGLCLLADAAVKDDFKTFALLFDGLVFQMLAHGLISSALFFCIGMLYRRSHSRLILDYGGLADLMPFLAAFMSFFALANSALPGTAGFVGEFLVILGAFQLEPVIGLIACTSILFNAAYNLNLIKRLFYGSIRNKSGVIFDDCLMEEKIILGLLAFLILLLGICPFLVTEPLGALSMQIFQGLHRELQSL